MNTAPNLSEASLNGPSRSAVRLVIIAALAATYPSDSGKEKISPPINASVPRAPATVQQPEERHGWPYDDPVNTTLFLLGKCWGVVVEGEVESWINEMGKKHGVEPALIKALIIGESTCDNTLVSTAGARGYMQLMPKLHSPKSLVDWRQNIDEGTAELAENLRRYNGDEKLALAGYNAGPGAVRKYKGIPPYQETQAYIPKVLYLRDHFTRFFSSPLATDQNSPGKLKRQGRRTTRRHS